MMLVATGFDWSEECTIRENWVGGHRKSGEQIWGQDDLDALLSETFYKIDGPFTIPSVKRINKRKYSYNNIDVSVWEKK